MTEDELLEQLGTGVKHLSDSMMEIARTHAAMCNVRNKQQRWTKEDVEDAKAVWRLWHDWLKSGDRLAVTKTTRHVIAQIESKEHIHYYDHCYISRNTFPSLEINETVRLDEIIGEI